MKSIKEDLIELLFRTLRKKFVPISILSISFVSAGKKLCSEITRIVSSPLGASILPQVTTYRPHKPPLMAFILLLLVRAATTKKKNSCSICCQRSTKRETHPCTLLFDRCEKDKWMVRGARTPSPKVRWINCKGKAKSQTFLPSK